MRRRRAHVPARYWCRLSWIGGSKRVHELAPHASSPPPAEAIIAASARAITFRQITPWRARSQHSKDATEETSIIRTGHPVAYLESDHSYSVSSYHMWRLRFATLTHLRRLTSQIGTPHFRA